VNDEVPAQAKGLEDEEEDDDEGEGDDDERKVKRAKV